MSDTLTVVDHPLVTDKLSQLRDVATDMARFRSLMHEVSFTLGYEALRDSPMSTRLFSTHVWGAMRCPSRAGQARQT